MHTEQMRNELKAAKSPYRRCLPLYQKRHRSTALKNTMMSTKAQTGQRSVSVQQRLTDNRYGAVPADWCTRRAAQPITGKPRPLALLRINVPAGSQRTENKMTMNTSLWKFEQK